MTGRESIGSRLAQLRREKAAREHRDILQTVAADELGASPAAYSRWESDLRKPNEEWLGKLARYFGTTVPFIHYGVGNKTSVSGETDARFSADRWTNETVEAKADAEAEEAVRASGTTQRKNAGRKR